MTKKIPDFKETLSLQKYRGAIDFLQSHIQLLDASLIEASKQLDAKTNKKENINSALGLNPTLYKCLNHPVRQHKVLIKHSQKQNIEFAILRLYNLFTVYLKDITREMFAKNPMLVVEKAVVNKSGADKENLVMTFAEIIRLNKIENIQEQMVLKIFRSIEELRSTSKLLDKILKDTKANIPKTTTEEALMYLEMRHLFVHNRGIVDNKYLNTYGKKFTPELKEKKELPTKMKIFEKALIAVTNLVLSIDKELILHKIVDKRKFKIQNTNA